MSAFEVIHFSHGTWLVGPIKEVKVKEIISFDGRILTHIEAENALDAIQKCYDRLLKYSESENGNNKVSRKNNRKS